VQRVRKVRQVLKAEQGYRVRLVREVRRAFPEQQVVQGFLCRVLRVHKVRKVREVRKVLKVNRVSKGLKVNRGQPVFKVL
jgi:hypothetical protein